jgi:hypothetical protein
VAHPLQNVRAIQPGSAHAYAHSICRRSRWSFYFANLKPFNAAVGCNDDCFHAMNGNG